VVLSPLHDHPYRVITPALQKSSVTSFQSTLSIWLSPLWRSTSPVSLTREFPNIFELIDALTLSRASGFSKTRRVINPYEFEPGTPYVVEDACQTTISDFTGNGNEVPSPSMRAAHMKNSRSEGNAMYMARKPTSLNVPQSRPNGHAIHRSESSSRLNPHRSAERDNRSPSPDIAAYYAEDEAAASPTRRGRSRSRIAVGRGRPHQDSPSRQLAVESSTIREFCPPTHIIFQNHSNRSPPKSSSPNRHLTRSSTRILDDVPERDEFDNKINDADLFVGPDPNGLKKRSRSPMKKMFGEYGWLGRSPDELQAGKLSSKKSAPGRKEKTSVMGRLRTKIEELVSALTIMCRNAMLTARNAG
jgi:hypothetical protein